MGDPVLSTHQALHSPSGVCFTALRVGIVTFHLSNSEVPALSTEDTALPLEGGLGQGGQEERRWRLCRPEEWRSRD